MGRAIRLAPDGVLPTLGAQARSRGVRTGWCAGLVLLSACSEAAAPAANDVRDDLHPSLTRAEPARSEPAVISAEASADAGPLPQTARPYEAVATGTVVFQSDVAGRPKIFALDVATGQVRQVTHGADWRDESPRWSPDGQSIAFSSNRAHYGAEPEAGTPDLDVYVMRADGTQVRRLTTDPGNDQDPSWLPDGRSLVFSSDRASRGDLFRVRLADGHTDRLTTNFVGRAIMPAVAPDGSKVAFAAQTLRVGDFWNFQVHILDLATGRTTPVAASGGACWPSWTPDGSAIFNVQLDREPSSIQRRELSGAVAVAHASPTLWSYYPRVSPDGAWLVVSVSPAHHDGENWDLALVSTTDPSRRIPLTTGAGNDRLADWKP